MVLSSCDENRLAIAAEAERCYKCAPDLVRSKKYEEALRCYLYAFDNGHLVSGWGGVRLSYIPSAIAKLGKVYPPAKSALLERRNFREKQIREQDYSFAVIHEWSSLNGYLDDRARELEFIGELQRQGRLTKELEELVIRSNFNYLLTSQQYHVLGKYFDRFGYDFFFQSLHYDMASLFPRESKVESQSETEYWKSIIKRDGTRVFELALGLRKVKKADEILKRVLKYACDEESFKMLIAAANRAGNSKKADGLRRKAKKLFGNDFEVGPTE